MNVIIVPSALNGEQFFIKEKMWENISIAKCRLSDIKYIAIYVKKPIYKILYYAKITKIEEYTLLYKYRNNTKYRIYFEKIKKIDIILNDSKNRKLIIQSPRYTTLEKLNNSSKISELF